MKNKISLLISFLLSVNYLSAQNIYTNNPAENVPANCVLGGDGVVYKGVNRIESRNFSSENSNSRNVANWSAISSMPGFEGSGASITSTDSNGDSVLICGDFTMVNGQKAYGVAMYCSSLNQWKSFPNPTVFPELVSIYKNEFYLLGARIDSTTTTHFLFKYNGTLEKWDTIVSPIYGSSFNCLKVNSQNIFLNGPTTYFSISGTTLNGGLARISKSTLQPFSMTDSVLYHITANSTITGYITGMALDENNLFVTGLFDEINNIHSFRVIRYDLNNMQWDSLSFPYTTVPTHIELHSGNLYVLASTTSSVYKLYKLNLSNSSWSNTTFSLQNPTGGGSFYDLAVNDSVAYFIGKRVDSQDYYHAFFYSFNLINHTLKAIDTSSGGYFYRCNMLNDNSLFIGGIFRTVSGINCDAIIKYKNNYVDLGTGASKCYIATIVPFGNKYVIGGEFKYINNVYYNNVAIWDPVANTYDSLGAGVYGWVNDIDVEGNDIYLAGGFMYAGSSESHGIAKYNVVTHQWTYYGNHLENNNVFSIAVMDNKIFVAGCFMADYYNEISQTWLANQYMWGPSGTRINKFLKKGNSIIMLGNFTPGIIQYFPTTDLFQSINFPSQISSYNSFATGVVSGEDVYLVGALKNISTNIKWAHVSKYSFQNSQWTAYDTVVLGSMDAIAVTDSNIYLGGQSVSLFGSWSSLLVYNFNSGQWCHAGHHSNTERQPGVRALFADANKIYVGGDFIDAIPGLASPQFALFTQTSDNCFPDNYVAPTNSISEIEQSDFAIYPNPISDFVYISIKQNEKGIISVSDLQGKIIFSQNISGGKNLIHLGNFSSGIYFMKLEMGNTTQVKKIVVAE